MRFLIAKKRFQLEVGSPHQLIKKSSGEGILLSNVCHLAIDALMEPSEPDHVDTGVRRSIVASDTRHRTASGGWWMVMNRGDSGLCLPSYHRQRFAETVNWNLKRANKALWTSLSHVSPHLEHYQKLSAGRGVIMFAQPIVLPQGEQCYDSIERDPSG